MSSGLQQLLERRTRRAIAVILSVKEREADPFLPDENRAVLRKVILDQLNDLCAIAGDILESASQDLVYNDLYLAKLDEIHALLTEE